MADAPTAPSGKTDEQKKADEAKKAAAKKAQEKKAADQKAADQSAPTETEAVAQAPNLNGVATGVNGIPTLLDSRQARDELAKGLGDLEQTISRVETGLSAHFDLTGLRRHLEGARKWFASELGLEVKDGNVVRGDGGSQLPNPSDNAGSTGDESKQGEQELKEAAKNRAKAEKNS